MESWAQEAREEWSAPLEFARHVILFFSVSTRGPGVVENWPISCGHQTAPQDSQFSLFFLLRLAPELDTHTQAGQPARSPEGILSTD